MRALPTGSVLLNVTPDMTKFDKENMGVTLKDFWPSVFELIRL